MWRGSGREGGGVVVGEGWSPREEGEGVIVRREGVNYFEVRR